MATYTETKIFEGLAKHIDDLVLSPVLPIAMPGVDFTPVESGYLHVKHFPNRTRQSNLGDMGYNLHQGIFQVDVVLPVSSGEVELREVAGEIIAHFKRGTDITRESQIIRVVRPPYANQVLGIDGMAVLPVTIRYQAFAANPD